MTEAFLPLIIAGAALLIVAILCAAGLSAWRGWLDLKHAQLRARPATDPAAHEEDQPSPAVLIEVAAVKERLRRLEAIANGVEL